MAEQNQNPHPEAGGERSADNGAGKNRRHRHHRHHRGHNNRPTDREGNLPKTENAEAVKPEATTPAEKPHTDKEHKKPDHRKDGKNGNQQNNQNATNGNGHNNKKGDRHHGQKNRRPGGNRSRGPESRPYDPYEAPSRQEIELSELRAQIVLKSADGSVPTAYTPAAAPAPARRPFPAS